MIMKPYLILVAYSPEDLEAKVSEALLREYALYGPSERCVRRVTTQHEDQMTYNEYVEFSQTMILPDVVIAKCL